MMPYRTPTEERTHRARTLAAIALAAEVTKQWKGGTPEQFSALLHDLAGGDEGLALRTAVILAAVKPNTP